ncbi:MAG: hypothetical protein WBR21_08455 [Rouxiella badensis]|uniref:hypothetical protein n=1 Tax=Rouxiella badensis TaxID=1646377 RepID=UPI0003680C82|nr:hypothetical protein [Rouxiella badensis]QII37856.1 hypothetical protein G3M83_09165 [Rouxiella badensis]
MKTDEQAQDAQFISQMQGLLSENIQEQLNQQARQRQWNDRNGVAEISWDEFAGNYS